MTNSDIKRHVHRVMRRMGWDLTRYPAGHTDHRRQLLLRSLEIEVVVDVGANTGQYGRGLRDAGYSGRIVSFEPLPTAFDELRTAARNDHDWTCVQAAVGAEDDELSLHVAGNSVSSSLLPMLPRHEDAAPGSRTLRDVQVPVRRLDNLLAPLIGDQQRTFLKVDAQGYESKVLDGVGTLLSRISAVEMELSLVHLYDGQPLMPELVDRLDAAGFRLAALYPGFHDPRTGESLQVDGTFVRR